MDIESFNRELAKKVATANGHEKRNELRKAIDTWISITEMTLKASKDPNIDNSYRNMLIKKTEQIVNHIKQLKVKISIPKPEEEINFVQESIPQEEKAIINEDIKNSEHYNKGKELNNEKIPEGFLEVKASEDFKILTPHEDLDQNILKDARKIYKLDDDETEEIHNSNIIIEPSKDKKIRICFACGAENPSNVKKCKSCSTDLV